MIVLSLEQFASRRRSAQERIEEALRPIVTRAIDGTVNTDGYAELLNEVRAQWRVAYADEAGSTRGHIPGDFIDDVRSTLARTDRTKVDTNTVERITVWLATAILSHSTITASDDDEAELFLEWVDMGDSNVRHTHQVANGQRVPIGEPFTVGGQKMPYPGYPGVDIELWINCRCTVRPVLASEALVAATDPTEGVPADSGQPESSTPSDGYEGVTHAGLAVQASDTGRVLMLQRTLDPTDAPDVQGTWEFPGGGMEEGETPEAAALREFTEETGLGVPDGEITGGWRSEDGVYQGFVLTVAIEREAFGEINPDVAAAEAINPDDPERRRPDVTAWFSLEQIQGLGAALRPECHNTDWSQFSLGGGDLWHAEATPEEADMPENETDDPALVAANPFASAPITLGHGVLTVEDTWSGDKRRFGAGALRTRPLPTPLSWQRSSSEGHSNSVTVFKISRMERVGKEIRYSGNFIVNAESDEVQALIAEFGKFGVSVDADDVSMEFSEEEGSDGVTFNDARSCGGSIVQIPAFHEAYIALGPEPADFFDGGEPLDDGGESMVAAIEAADISPGKTEDGPGWLTNYEDTDRLRDWWASAESGVNWGVAGDFNRCRVKAAEHVKPEYVSGFCANRHYDALGFWPGQEATVGDKIEGAEQADSLSLVASRFGNLKAPAEWFSMAEPDLPCPLTITEEGQVYGHVATWKQAHANTAAYGTQRKPPKSSSGYREFLLGGVLLDNGETIPAGCLTIGAGHAGGTLRLRDAQRHYDDATTAFADVTATDGKVGIWVCGWVRPGVSEEMVVAARASKLSGDWRKDAFGNWEMIAALAVNAPGYSIPRVAAGITDGEQISLVAANVVASNTSPVPAGFDMLALADAVAERLAAREQAKADMAALRSRFSGA